ncbi:MAG: hypothetical protein Q8T03_12065 [Bacteroidota bacterium]|nr:hypothetical protein [Bacteroidota bacterium]
MPIQFDKFDQQKIDRLKSHLESMAAKSTPKFYEIFVDGLKAVPKTDEPKEFEGYEDYMTPDTNQIKIVIYCSGASPRNDQYVFSMKAKSNEEALDLGLSGISFATFSKNDLKKLQFQREQKAVANAEIKELNEEIDGLYKELNEKSTYIAQLEDAIEIAKANGNKIGGIHAGEVLSIALDGLLKRNLPKIVAATGMEGLAGLLEENNNTQTETKNQPETEVTVKKKQSEPTQELSEQEKHFLALYRAIQKHFSEEEMDSLIEIIEILSKDKSKIDLILELLSEEVPEEKENETTNH